MCVPAGQCYNMTPLIDQELEKIDRLGLAVVTFIISYLLFVMTWR